MKDLRDGMEPCINFNGIDRPTSPSTMISAQNAGIQSVAYILGTLEIDKLLNAQPDIVIGDPRDGIQLLSKRFTL